MDNLKEGWNKGRKGQRAYPGFESHQKKTRAGFPQQCPEIYIDTLN